MINDNIKEAYRRLLSDENAAFFVDITGEHLFYINTMFNKMSRPIFEHILSGSFNPLHGAHRYIYNNIKSPHKCFEISLQRTDKEFLTFENLTVRLQQFAEYAPVLITNSPLMQQKIGILRSFTLSPLTVHLGTDVFKRMLQDHGRILIQGMNAIFAIYKRDNSFITELPHNCFMSNLPERFQGLSSSQLRIGVNNV